MDQCDELVCESVPLTLFLKGTDSCNHPPIGAFLHFISLEHLQVSNMIVREGIEVASRQSLI